MTFGPPIASFQAPTARFAPIPEGREDDYDPEKPLSASLVSAFECERKGAYQIVERIPRPPDSSTRLGSTVHKVAEDYLTKGLDPNLNDALMLPKGRGAPGENTFYPGQIFQAGKHLLPPVGSLRVEGRLTWQTPGIRGPIDWKGTLDGLGLRQVSDHGASYLPPSQWGVVHYPGEIDPYRPFVLDHKTTSDKRYALHADPKAPGEGEEDKYLGRNIQAIEYAWATLEKFQTDTVDLFWVYYLTRGRPKAWPVELTLTRAEVAEQIVKIDVKADRVIRIRKEQIRAKDLDPNTSVCPKYGGCPYRDRCPLSLTQRWGGSLSASFSSPSPQGSPMSVESYDQAMARIQAQQAQGGLPPPGSLPGFAAPQAAPQPQGQQTWAPGMPLNGHQQYLLAQQGVTWAAIAMAAGSEDGRIVAPDPNTANNYDTVYANPQHTNGQPVMRAPSGPGASFPISPSAINPTDGPRFAPASPEQMPPRMTFDAPQNAPQPGYPLAQGFPTNPGTPGFAPPQQSFGVPASQLPPSGLPQIGQAQPDPFAGMDRDALKDACVKRGLCTSGYRGRNEETFRTALRTNTPIVSSKETEEPAAPAALQASMSYPGQASPGPMPAVQVGSVPASTGNGGPPGTGFKLYIHCRPTKRSGVSQVIQVSDLCAQVFPKIKEMAQVDHYALIDFGKGRGLFCSLVEELVKGSGWGPAQAVIVDHSPEGQDLITTLERYAGEVIRGFARG